MGLAAVVKGKRYGALPVFRPGCDRVRGKRTPGKRHKERENQESSCAGFQRNTSPSEKSEREFRNILSDCKNQSGIRIGPKRWKRKHSIFFDYFCCLFLDPFLENNCLDYVFMREMRATITCQIRKGDITWLPEYFQVFVFTKY
jgi:hypothetical protein